MPAPPATSAAGKALAQRREQRREALLDAVRAHLAVTAWREATVFAVARLAGCVPGSFYLVFEDLEAAVRVLIERERAGGEPLEKHLEAIDRLLEVEQHLPATP